MGRPECAKRERKEEFFEAKSEILAIESNIGGTSTQN